VLKSIAGRLMSGFLVVIVIISAIFSYVGIRFIENRVIAEAQRRVAESLMAASEMYANELNGVQQVVRLTADRLFLKEALQGVAVQRAAGVLAEARQNEGLDVLVVTDRTGRVLWRPANPSHVGDGRAGDPLVQAVMKQLQPVAATIVIDAAALTRESPGLAPRASTVSADAAAAAGSPQSAGAAAMMISAAAPVVDGGHRLIGMVYGGVLLNDRYVLVDRLKHGVFQDAQYQGKAVGAATVFLYDVRIATTVLNADGTRATGTRVEADVYRQVVAQGRPWVAGTFAVNDWYIAAYQPIRGITGQSVGMLGVGLLEAPYLDLRHRSTLLFLAITLAGAVLTIGLSYLVSWRLAVPLRQLVAASGRLARGDLAVTVETPAVTEFAELAESFNAMAVALRKRDERLQEFARRKIMESERLALIGQLAADVAHELNNPLQGIVTYSHLLRERGANGDGSDAWIEKIVVQADRSTKIIRGLLDFARPQTPHTRPVKLNGLLDQCIGLVENQALFQNIRVEKRFAADLPDVVIDPALMQQVFMNLIINAAEAMPEGGSLVLSTAFDSAARLIEVGFADSGHGIRPEDVDRVFEPFFTTKAVGHGTGLGLAISFGIVKEHHGTIAVESRLGGGTAFTVSLPLNGVPTGEG
jgi:two-component system, NtrC family, sensor kinase